MKLRSVLIATAMWALAFAGKAADAKYIFYFIGDGMGMGPVLAAETYNREVLKNDKPLTMMQFPTVSWCMTYSANSPVTDSAAAGTALATGTKTKNSMLGMSPDTVAVESIAKKFHDLGYGVGVVTSVAPDDATPGAFYAHVPNRSKYYEIGCQAAASGYEFIAGAGLRGVKDKDGAETDLLDVMKKNGVRVIYGPEEIKKIDSRRVMLVNTKGSPLWNIGYTIDSVAGSLTLPLIAETCLSHLEKTTPDRFFMMVEGGNIDYALHANDGGAAITRLELARLLAEAFEIEAVGGSPFADTDDGLVAALAELGVVSGYEDGSFRADMSISRAEFAKIIAKMLGGTAKNDKAEFTDAVGHWAESFIALLTEKGIINGYTDGTFRPDMPITRAEAVAIINRTVPRNGNLTTVKQFADVDSSFWAYEEIMKAAR